MHELLSRIDIKLNENIYLKDPNSSELGKRIVSNSVDLIAELGFDHFTIKKLGNRIESPEASVYRYFESKHKILLYITSWYWGWMEYQIVFALANISSPEERLKKAIDMLTGDLSEMQSFPHINKENLQNILETESSKAYLRKEVDHENSNGVFIGYKELVARVSHIILEINPDFPYPQMLVSTVVEGAHHQRYFADHLPRLTNASEDKSVIQEFYRLLVFKTIL